MKPGRLQAVLTLMRIELAGFSFVGILGAMSVVGANLRPLDILVLFLANVLLVVLGFCDNDYRDLAVDRRTGVLDVRPLVNGSLSPTVALRITQISFVLNVAMLALVYSWSVAGLMALSLGLALIYNATSKILPGADLFYAVSAAFLALAGVEAVAEGLWPPLAWIITGILLLEHLFFNLVSGGLKDVEVDARSGVRTLAVLWSRAENGGIRLNRRFWLLAMAVKLATLLLVALGIPLVEGGLSPGLSVLLYSLMVLALGLSLRLLSTDLRDRKEVLDRTKAQEMTSKAMLPVLLLPMIGPVWVLVIATGPILWFALFNRLVHGGWFGNPRTF